jgi:hypothetical protein
MARHSIEFQEGAAIGVHNNDNGKPTKYGRILLVKKLPTVYGTQSSLLNSREPVTDPSPDTSNSEGRQHNK